MQYLFLVYRDEKQWGLLSPDERDAIEKACLFHEQRLQQQGYLVASGDRRNWSTGIIAQIIEGTLSLTEDTGTDELVSFHLVNARDLNEAIQVATRMPGARYGPIVIRASKEPV